jgi:hypothetical protein
MTHREPEAAHESANQMGKVLLSFVLAALAACLVWRFGEPLSLNKSGAGEPWWVYLLFFIRPVFALRRVLGDPPKMRKPIRDRTFSGSTSIFPEDPTAPILR